MEAERIRLIGLDNESSQPKVGGECYLAIIDDAECGEYTWRIVNAENGEEARKKAEEEYAREYDMSLYDIYVPFVFKCQTPPKEV